MNIENRTLPPVALSKATQANWIPVGFGKVLVRLTSTRLSFTNIINAKN